MHGLNIVVSWLIQDYVVFSYTSNIFLNKNVLMCKKKKFLINKLFFTFTLNVLRAFVH